MSNIYFETKISRIGIWTLLRLPESVSKKLPSRGATPINGTLNKTPFLAVLEPDGKGSHWFKIDQSLIEATSVEHGDVVELQIEPSKVWPEPAVPSDLEIALKGKPYIFDLWTDITPVASYLLRYSEILYVHIRAANHL